MAPESKPSLSLSDGAVLWQPDVCCCVLMMMMCCTCPLFCGLLLVCRWSSPPGACNGSAYRTRHVNAYLRIKIFVLRWIESIHACHSDHKNETGTIFIVHRFTVYIAYSDNLQWCNASEYQNTRPIGNNFQLGYAIHAQGDEHKSNDWRRPIGQTCTT